MLKSCMALAFLILFATSMVTAEAGSPGSVFATGVESNPPWLLPIRQPSNLVLAQASTIQKKGKNNPQKNKKKYMERNPPPILKLEGDNGPPVHDVRRDLSNYEIDQLNILAKRRRASDRHSMDPNAVEKDYDRLYRKLYRQRTNLIEMAKKEPNRKVKSEQLKQALELSNTLDRAKPPNSAKEGEFSRWNPVRDAEQKLIKLPRLIRQRRELAKRAINSADEKLAYLELDRLRRAINSTNKSLIHADAIQRDFLDSGVVPRTGFHDLDHLAASVEDGLQDLINWTREYEKALKRKWPNQEDEVEDFSGPLRAPKLGRFPSKAPAYDWDPPTKPKF